MHGRVKQPTIPDAGWEARLGNGREKPFMQMFLSRIFIYPLSFSLSLSLTPCTYIIYCVGVYVKCIQRLCVYIYTYAHSMK